jgi:DNA-binding CsgD family transcriptional regulator
LASVRTTSRGRLVIVAGEAGVGKTALLRRFCDEHHGSVRILWGACDALFTPRPLGPLLDIAEAVGGEFEELARRGGQPHEVARELLRELDERAPTVVVLEDVHWADEATLDVLRLVGRRVEAVPALIIASCRDDALKHADPLRIVLGELATDQAIGRLELLPLSPAAVAALAEPHGVDAGELYRKTAGNPFFVTEVLAGGSGEVPRTIRDAVHARLARLSAAERTVLEAVAVVPQQTELWLLEALAGGARDRLDECVASGMLTYGAGSVAFRHELARVAVEHSLPPDRTVDLHRMAIAGLVAHAGAAPDPARLAHHAEAAAESEAVRRFAPAAAARAASLGAHREAAAQYARALRFSDGLPPETLAELLERHSHECFLTYQFEGAIEARQRALECHRQRGNVRKQADVMLALSWLLWHTGRTAEADDAAREAVALLERLAPGRELAIAYSMVCQLRMEAEDTEAACAWGMRANQLAERLDDTEVRVRTLVTLGTIDFLNGSAEGKEKLERALESAQQAGLDEQVGRAFANLAWAATRMRLYGLADRYVKAGLAYYGESEVALWSPYLLAMRAHCQLALGHWAAAAQTAASVVDDTRAAYALDRPLSLAVLGLVRARRGEPDRWPPLDEALALVQPTGELQRLAPVAAARAEALWLEGRRDEVASATQVAFELATRRDAAWEIGELACWRLRAGIREPIPAGAAEPYALQFAGEWARAARRWTALGCPYDAALALGDAQDDGALRRALGELHRLGARPAAAIVARRLRKRGARGLPRGPRPATRENPANLTPRELEVLALVAQGLRNADVAERLVVAEKTVDHHVSAILRKLGVSTRRHASAEAARLGLTRQDG